MANLTQMLYLDGYSREHGCCLLKPPNHIYLRVILRVPLTDSDMLQDDVRSYTMVAKEISFSIGKTIRCDTYAKVMLAYSKANNKKIAVKCVYKGYPELRCYIKYILPRETGLLKMLRGHPNVVKFIGLVETGKYAILATEYVEGTNLQDYIILKAKLDEDEAREIFKELLNTVATCHSLGICIRGITCENVLLDTNLVPKISNFEHAIVRGYDKVDIFEGTLYSPPEVFCSSEYEPEPVDVWTLGVILYSMVTGVHPFQMGAVIHSKKLPLSFPVKLSAACYSIIRKMLQISPMKRIKISELKRDIWLNNITLRYIDYQLTDTRDDLHSGYENEGIAQSFSAEISMSKKKSNVAPFEIEHVISESSSEAVNDESNGAELEFISSLLPDSHTRQAVHEYYNIISDLVDDKSPTIKSAKYKNAINIDAKSVKDANSVQYQDATMNTTKQKYKDAKVNTKHCNHMDAQVNTSESFQESTTQYILVIAPPISKKKSKEVIYRHPSNVEIVDQGSNVKMILTVDGQKMEFSPEISADEKSGDLRLTSKENFVDGTYTIQKLTKPVDADKHGSHGVKLGGTKQGAAGNVESGEKVLSQASSPHTLQVPAMRLTPDAGGNNSSQKNNDSSRPDGKKDRKKKGHSTGSRKSHTLYI